MGISTNDCLAVGFSKEFLILMEPGVDIFPQKEKYGLLLLGETGTMCGAVNAADTLICPGKIFLPFAVECRQVITCGMRQTDTLSFSCINDDRAVLSLSRSVENTQPGEVCVRFRKNLSVYENLVYQALRLVKNR